MSLVIKVLDKRLKKYSNQHSETVSQSSNANSELKSIKLNPLQATPLQKSVKKSLSVYIK
jgi:hypothetical protein